MLIAELLAISLWVCGQVCVFADVCLSTGAAGQQNAHFMFLQDVLKAVLDFIVKLLVANGSMVSFCLRRLIFCLIPPNPLLEMPVPGEVWQPSAEQAAVQDQIIKYLADILLLVPTAPKTMLSELSQRMPFKFQTRAAPCMYFRAVYQLSQTPAGDCVRDGLQAAMVDCLLNIDVEIKWQDIADQQAGKLVLSRPCCNTPCYHTAESLGLLILSASHLLRSPTSRNLHPCVTIAAKLLFLGQCKTSQRSRGSHL